MKKIFETGEHHFTMNKTAIILDLDGTILDTLDDLTDSVNFALSGFGFPTHTREKIRSIVGNGAKNLILNALPKDAAEDNLERTLAAFKAHYETNKTNKTAPYDGIIDVLRELVARGCKLAIVSNKHDDAVQGLHRQFFSDVCDFALGNCDTLPKKPAPDMVHYAISKLGKDVPSAVYVGDSEVDIETAKNSGIPCVSVLWGFRDKDVLKSAGATVTVATPGELIAAIEKL